MEVSTVECKPDSYVGCPAPTVDLPECEHGWEFGNNTAVCATQAFPGNLPETGWDGSEALGWGLLGVALLCVGIALTIRKGRR